MKKILLIEDHADIRKLITHTLKGYALDVAANIQEARAHLAATRYDLILLDVNLPDGNGFKFCGELRANGDQSSIPIVFLTAQGALDDRLMGFALGARDYVTKPFAPAELNARVKLRLEEVGTPDGGGGAREWFVKRDLHFNLLSQKLYVGDPKTEAPLDLSSLEYRILLYFARHEDHVISRSQLLDSVWGRHVTVTERNVDTQISKIRKKITGGTWVIEAVPNEGYRFFQPGAQSFERAAKAA